MKKKEKKYGLFKAIMVFILIAIVLSWLIPNGSYEGEYITEGLMSRVGINDLAWLFYYGAYFALDKIMLLLIVGGLYGVLVKLEAYERIVSGIAKALDKHKKLFVVIISVIITLLTSILTNCFVLLVFIPFIIAILNRMKLDKMTIMAVTFGSILIGTLGATYGTEGIQYLNQYMLVGTQSEGELINAAVLIRFGILGIALVLFNFFTITHMNKKEKNMESTDMFLVEDIKDTKKRSTIPLIIIGLFTFILIILGYVAWNTNFGIGIFDTFHETLTNLKIGNQFYIIRDILGTNMGAFGDWDLFSIGSIVFLLTILIGVCYRVSFNEFLENFVAGAKKMLYPILCTLAAFILMVVVYMSPYIATIINKLLTLTDGFNLATMTLSTFILNIFHTDLGYTGYIIGNFLVSEYVDYVNPIYVMLVSTYGFVQLFIPTSIVLGIGLTSLNVKYSDWLKYIFKFLIGMFICLMIIFILMTII